MRGRDRRRLPSWQHLLRGLGCCCVALSLAGCEISGTVDVRSANQVEANLVITDAEADCLGLTEFAGLAIKGTPNPGGSQICRANGTVDLGKLKEIGVTVSEVGEYVTVELAMPPRVGPVPLKVDISFPGAVLDTGGATAWGNRVTLTQSTGRETLNTTKVVALSHPGPQWWVIGLSSGFAGGVGLTLVLLWLFGRRRRLAARPLSPVPPEPSTTVRDPEYEALFAPPSADEPARVPLSPAPSGKAGEAEPGADHRVWGPPGDRGDPID